MFRPSKIVSTLHDQIRYLEYIKNGQRSRSRLDRSKLAFVHRGPDVQTQQDRINSARPDSLFGIHKKWPKKSIETGQIKTGLCAIKFQPTNHCWIQSSYNYSITDYRYIEDQMSRPSKIVSTLHDQIRYLEYIKNGQRSRSRLDRSKLAFVP
ncbi:hypothetical protein CDAR_376821 [Caerostris darwini]|uniref:Uncharacterized protein n=1 Tax=Caerostris darwini TaxID=1538125 RepID=A0AAV4STX6_9ARAC|nr:hypothetical protein CDAR_376821 [Caerostris darwini]